MKLLTAVVVVAEEVEEDLDAAVVAAVALAVIFPMMITHRPLLTKDLLKEILGIPQKDAVMVDPVGPTVVAAVDVVVVEVLAMVKLVMKDVQEEHLNATVGLDEEMNSNGKGLDVVTGVHRMMTLLR